MREVPLYAFDEAVWDHVCEKTLFYEGNPSYGELSGA